MKFVITMPNGKKKTREATDKKEIDIMLKRGWKEVVEKSKPASKKKSNK